jgi:signal transduction histidine kinase
VTVVDARFAPTARPAVEPARASEPLLTEPGFVALVRWVFAARLGCLALATPAVVADRAVTAGTLASLGLLTLSSVVFALRRPPIRVLIRHPLLALLDTELTIALLFSVPVGQPAALTVVCSALVAGLLFPRAVLVVLMVPLVLACLGAPTAFLLTMPTGWQAWLAVLAGLPSLVLGICVIGSVVRRSTQAMVSARTEMAEALAAVGAADERARLAREMHDSVGKSIHGISLGAKALRRLVVSNPAQAREVAGSIASAADQAAREARALLITLRAGQPDRPTLDVVSELLDGWQRETGVEATLTTVEVVDADPVVNRQLVAALGEILHNVDKHAHAGRVTVQLLRRDDQVELVVSDDGVGFDPARAADREREGHYGLRGLRERAEDVGGTVEISSADQRGTTIRWTALRHPLP